MSMGEARVKSFFPIFAVHVFSNKNLNDMPKKVTSARVASKASKALTDGRSSARTKSIAGSALSQREKSSRRK